MKLKRFFEYLAVLFFILNCNSVYSTLSGKNFFLKESLIIILFSITVLQIYTNKFDKQKISETIKKLILYYSYMLLFYFWNNIMDTYEFALLYLIMFPILFFLYNTSQEEIMIKNILYKFPIVMTGLAILSLFFYFFGTITNIISPSGSVLLHWGTIRNVPSYFGIHFDTQIIYIFGTKFIRNTGIFAEAPMFSLNLTIALAIEVFLKQKKIDKKAYILIITIFTTLSTTGIGLVLMIYILSFFQNKDEKKIKQIIKLLIFPIVFIVVVQLFVYFFNDKKESNSYSLRIDDYIVSYLAWKDHLIIGNGYKNSEAISNYMKGDRGEGLSNSIMPLLAHCGIYLFVFYSIPLIRNLRYGVISKNRNLIWFLLTILVLFITTIFLYKPIIINFLAIGYANSTRKGEEKNV